MEDFDGYLRTILVSEIALPLRIASVLKDTVIDAYDFERQGIEGGPWTAQIGFTVLGTSLPYEVRVAGEMTPNEIGPNKCKTVNGLEAWVTPTSGRLPAELSGGGLQGLIDEVIRIGVSQSNWATDVIAQ